MQWQFFPPKTQLTEIIQMTTKVISSDLFLLKIGAKVICSMKAKLQKYISYSSDIAMTSFLVRSSLRRVLLLRAGGVSHGRQHCPLLPHVSHRQRIQKLLDRKVCHSLCIRI